MNNDISIYVNNAVQSMLDKISEDKKIISIEKKHKNKLHFIPFKYRVFTGLLQSLNIQFGNFLEELLTLIIKENKNLELLEELSGKSINKFTIKKTNEKLIDDYITKRQTNHNESSEELISHFLDLKQKIIENENTLKFETDNIELSHDVDLLFRDKSTQKIYYLEIKYNDDHDSGKYVDINRKFLKTYAYLVSRLNIKTLDDLNPIIYYFNNKKLKGNIYTPETNIMRGEALFEKFTNFKYIDLDKYITNMSNNQDTLKLFDDLYNKIMKR